jgi:hypothetical protein
MNGHRSGRSFYLLYCFLAAILFGSYVVSMVFRMTTPQLWPRI